MMRARFLSDPKLGAHPAVSPPTGRRRHLPGKRLWTSVAMCCIAVAAASGCGRNPDTKFYILTPLPVAERPTDLRDGALPTVGLRPVKLPEQLDRPQIITRVGPNQLQLAEFDQWAAPLRESFARVLAEDLGILIPADRVTLFPWFGTAVEYEVAVDVLRFEGVLGGDCVLDASWSVTRRGAKEGTTGRSSHTEPAGESYATMVSAESRLIAELGRDIARVLRAIPR